MRKAPVVKDFEGAAKIVSGDDASHLDDASKKALAETVNAMRRYFRA